MTPLSEAPVVPVSEPSGKAAPGASSVMKIGVMGPLSGPAAGYGRSQLDGVRLAVEEINAGPGQLKVELVVVDDEADMSAAGDRVVELVYEDRVSAIIGAINSSVTHVVEMVAAKTRVPMITTTSTDPSITRTGTYWAFRCLADDILQGGALANRIIEVDHRRRPAILMQDNRYGKMGGREIERIARGAGFPPVMVRSFDGRPEAWPEVIETLRSSGADSIILWGLYKPCGRMVAAIRTAGIDLPIYGADGMVHPEFLRFAGSAAEGVIMTLPFNPCRDDETTRDFLSAFQVRYGRAADSFAAHSYDAMMLIWSASQRGECTDRTCIKDQLLKTRNHPGATGSITLDEDGNDIREVELAQVVGGSLVPLPGGSKALKLTEIQELPGWKSSADRRSSGWVFCPWDSGSR
jgi:branched-chain amino acid transport system substrate-binding protein